MQSGDYNILHPSTPTQTQMNAISTPHSKLSSPEPELHDAEDHLQVVAVPGAQAPRVVEQRGLQELALALIKHLRGVFDMCGAG